ncbi:hypothetical protein IV102_01680 [bacterium]|nr:hypothetical protein [bacterium]
MIRQKLSGIAFLYIFLAVATLSLSGCGGSTDGTSFFTGGSSNNPVPATVNISGTVAGTQIVALNASTNAEAARVTASGTPPTFALSLATGSYRFFLLENEGTARQRNYLLTQGATTVFTFASTSNINLNLGFVDTSSGNAVAQNNPLNVAGVSAGGSDTSIPAALGGTNFAIGDLQGTFSIHQFSASSPVGANPLWERTTLTINAQGLGTFSNTVDSLGGSNNSSNVQLSLSPAGILTIAGQSNFQGIVWLDKNKFVAVNGSTDRELIFGQRQPTGLTTANLAGTWIYSQISSDSPLGGSPTWGHGTMVFDANGNAVQSNDTNSDSGPSNGPIGAFAVAADGTVTQAQDNTIHLTLSQDLNFMVGTGDLGQPALFTLVRQTGAFTPADLGGSWNSRGLALVRTTPPTTEQALWRRAKISVNGATGAATVSSAVVSPPATASNGSIGNWSISAAGIVTSASDATLFGIMSPEKNHITFTSGTNPFRELFVLNR